MLISFWACCKQYKSATNSIVAWGACTSTLLELCIVLNLSVDVTKFVLGTWNAGGWHFAWGLSFFLIGVSGDSPEGWCNSLSPAVGPQTCFGLRSKFLELSVALFLPTAMLVYVAASHLASTTLFVVFIYYVCSWFFVGSDDWAGRIHLGNVAFWLNGSSGSSWLWWSPLALISCKVENSSHLSQNKNPYLLPNCPCKSCCLGHYPVLESTRIAI